ncbi:MAG: hypothetical protein WA919_09885 [Coleofasciculaceae cyanobacterium]
MMSRQRSLKGSIGSRNPYFSSLSSLARQLVIAGLFMAAIPTSGAKATSNPFQLCTAELQRASISDVMASKACAQALVPEDLSECVLRMSLFTQTISEQALVACTRVRRPPELATCVIDIGRMAENAQIASVLDHCRRSLEPLRFSECVVGLTVQTDLSPANSLETCIDAEALTGRSSPAFRRSPSTIAPQQFVPKLELQPSNLNEPAQIEN